MSQHFLLSARARTLSLATVLRMSDEEAETAFRALRWEGGDAICPHCQCPTAYECRRPTGSLRFRCKACRKDFSVTSGTLFAFHKMSLRNYLAATAIFVNEVKGKSALALSRDLDVQYKTAFVLSHKLREAMASELRGMRVGGEGETVEVDGAYFGGHVKPANFKENRRDRRLAKNQNGKRQVVVVARERGRQHPAGGVQVRVRLAGVDHRARVARYRLMADEAPSWNDLHAKFRDSPDRPWQALQRYQGHLHQRRRELLLPPAPRRGRPPPPHRGAVSGPLRPGDRLGARITAGWTTAGRFGRSARWRWLRRFR